MPALLWYLRRHRWQRRLLTVSLALFLGGVGALLALPHVQDYLLLRDLDSESLAVRMAAIPRGVQLAGSSPRTLRRLNDALDGASDRQFSAIVAVLKRLGELNSPARDPRHIDRMWTIELAGNPSAETRELFLGELALAGRDNRYVRKALATVIKDPAPGVRARSAPLAARLADDAALAALLADADPNVAAAAALAAGTARRNAHAGRLAEMLRSSRHLDVRSAAAYGLARADPNAAAGLLPTLLADADQADDAKLRDRLLHVMSEMSAPAARQAVLGVLRRAGKAGRHPPAAALLAAGRLHLTAAAPEVRGVLAAAARPESGVLIRQVHAAVVAAEALELPVRTEAEAICRKLWTYRWAYRLMLVSAARLLGRQVTQPQDDPNAPSPGQCVRTLRMGVVQDYEPTTWPAGTKPKLIRTPLPSAAAAVALWELKTQICEEYLRIPAGDDVTLSGDYVCWHLAVGDSERASRLAMEWLPPLDAPREQRVYDDDLRASGALLLAMAARTDQQAERARRRIRSRLEGEQMGGEDNFHVRGAYRCALAALGDRQNRDHVAGLLETGQFSQRRAIAALTLAGSLRGLDWLLSNPQVDDEDMLLLLLDEQLTDVLSLCTPRLPSVDAAASDDLQAWQLRILRDAYVIGHNRLRAVWPPASEPPRRRAARPAKPGTSTY